jgi:hypothetical protein
LFIQMLDADTGCWMQILDAGCWMLDTGLSYKCWVFASGIQVFAVNRQLSTWLTYSAH